MQRIISVLTAVHEAGSGHLDQAWESLRDQELPPEWSWEWVVQEDGSTSAVRALIPEDQRVSYRPGLAVANPGIVRNLGLARCRGRFVRVLDADDLLTPGALARDIAAMSRPGVGWCVSAAIDVSANGTPIPFAPPDPPEGRLVRGRLARWWRRDGRDRLRVHPASLCMRRNLLLGLGGWMALPSGEDTGLLLAAATVVDGWFVSEPGLAYRKWSNQMTASAAYRSGLNLDERTSLIEQRVATLELSRLPRRPRHRISVGSLPFP